MKILLFSTLFPNAANPSLGVFVENRMQHLRKDCDVKVKVIAPVPWFPFRSKVFGVYGQYARAPKYEVRKGVEIWHPRYITVPKVGMRITPTTLYHAGLRAAKKMIAEGFDFDVIDAHYLFPDGIAAAKIAKELGKPFTMTARGSDVTEIGLMDPYRDWIKDACAAAGRVMTVSESLRQDLVDMTGENQKISTLRNGVDLTVFYPLDYKTSRKAILKEIGVDPSFNGKLIVSVGWLIPRKRHDLCIELMARVDKAHLLIIGVGPEETALKLLVESLGLEGRVHFIGRVDHERLKVYHSGVDLLMLMSEREGWPNVLLEAMACGTPVLARAVGGVEEFVNVPEAGLSVQTKTMEDIAQRYSQLMAAYPKREDVRRYAESYSWEETSKAQWRIFSELTPNRDDEKDDRKC
ncbi:glycosyltransferase [Temperatibacter marinus]|uniref:Glycosyltransferase n=1 Tax=Temperatibacter marinus TaxID=1456591 RepID=A0AA52EDB8_9PROT|nr:glycosyltransferase [Temperatibacter marinus]WND02610.1 glycosyltransferase [Temperatibacter marinus]